MTDAPNNRSQTAAPTDDAPVSPRPVPLRRWIAGGVLGVLLLVFAIPMVLTAAPQECSACHEMRPYYESWRTSSHVGAAKHCLYCHAKPGALGYLTWQLGFWRMVGAHVAGAQVNTTPDNAPVVESCSRPECHSLNREASNAGDIKINHRVHVEQARIPCTRCHPGAVHAGVGGRKKLPPMSVCRQCHADKMQQCSYCHNEQRLGAPPAGLAH